MCGIAGLVDHHKQGNLIKTVEAMTEAIAHRGPDDYGIELADNGVVLGNRRLAVIDLSPKGHQPMSDETKNYWITYNGEVYNFKKLREKLISFGYKFYSTSDTEVILKLYIHDGVKAFAQLRGMFALAIWDKKRQSLVLARDHFGIKPLYYYIDKNEIVFGSEIKSLLNHPQVNKTKEIDRQALVLYFSTGFGAVPAPYSIFKQIKKLPPATYLIYKNQRVEIKSFWDISQTANSYLEFNEAVEKADALINQSVKDQMVADVTVGSFLSGGIDSSLIATLMVKNTPKRIKTFSIGFSDKSFDESYYAKKMAERLKTKHFQENFSEKDLLQSITHVLGHMDEPLADASILPMNLLAQNTRKKVTVALSGDGGDELFAGYPTYLAHRFLNYYHFIPNQLRQIMTKLINQLPASDKNVNWEWNLKRLANANLDNPAASHLDFMAPITITEKKNLFSQKIIDNSQSWFEKIYRRGKDFDQQRRLQHLDLAFFLAEDCLVKSDRISNLHSLEVRVPFLSVELAELVYSLPGKYHYQGLTSKRLLKTVARKYLPKEIIQRKKKGFGVPMSRWLKTDLKVMSHDLLNQSTIKAQGLFNWNYINQLLNEHETGRQNHRMIIWALICFEYWYQKWFKS